MENFTYRSKYVSETISIIVDFADVLPAGATIQGTPTVGVVVDSGYDPTPAAILYLGVSVTDGTIVEQRFRLGVPGVIYTLTWTVVSNDSINLPFIKTNYLAILPNIGSVAPNHIILMETSCLYPYQLMESMVSGVSWVSGFLGIIDGPEFLSSGISWQSGIIGGTSVSYTNPPEYLSSNIAWISGIIGGTAVSYAGVPENMKANITWISGLIGGTGISYAIPTDYLKSNISWVSGGIS